MKLDSQIKPFLKWAGGKTQLMEKINERLPHEPLRSGKITKYIEPFVGSGAVLFNFVNHHSDINEATILDINPELINVYTSIKKGIDPLIEVLKEMQNRFLPLETEARKEYYYQVREAFNKDIQDFDYENFGYHSIERAAQFLFLNRTCFNGLFRVNKKGEYNVPMGSYKNPTICNESVLRSANQFLQRVTIILGDYRQSNDFIDEHSFVYFDPPYRPLSQSSSFTSYSKFDFTDANQMDLATYFKELNEKGAYLMLSNSDPKNSDENDCFFDDLYKGFNIQRVNARRNINSKGSSRGEITELLITNY